MRLPPRTACLWSMASARPTASPGGRHVSLTVRPGEAVGLLGPNGAGKTTCFYMITGLIRPITARSMLDGFDITKMPMYRRARLGIGYLPQEASIFRGLTVEDNIRAVLEVIEPDRKKRAEELDIAARRIRSDAFAQVAGDCPVRRRAAPCGNRPGAGQPAVLHAAR
jgi:ABC-type Na+ transport system ATPase subunit NatA